MAGLAKLSEQIVDCQRRKVEQLCVAGKRANSAVGGLVKKCQQLQLRNCRDGGLDLSRQIEEMKRRGDELNKSLADAHKDVAKLTVAKKNVVQYADILLDNKKFILAAMKEERKKARAKLMQVHLRRRFLEKRPIHHR
uniref:Uncharacterized protein n=1 Tax=Plectus sambesii TaxID=2011161 RepID=A0A914USP2_9BILA